MAKIQPVKPGAASKGADKKDVPKTKRETRRLAGNENATTRETRRIAQNENATTRKTRGPANTNGTTRATD